MCRPRLILCCVQVLQLQQEDVPQLAARYSSELVHQPMEARNSVARGVGKVSFQQQTVALAGGIDWRL